MKSILKRIVVAVVIGTLASVLTLAKTIEKKVTFVQSVSVNGTVIKKGTYKVKFNEETSELTIEKGGKVVATTQARLEKTTDRSAFYVSSESGDPDKARTLVSVSLRDGNLVTIVNGADNKGSIVRQ